MNERIKELTEQSGLITYFGICTEDDEDSAIVTKFAELIVRECTNMLPDDSIRNKEGVHMFYVIREHFGVEK